MIVDDYEHACIVKYPDKHAVHFIVTALAFLANE